MQLLEQVVKVALDERERDFYKARLPLGTIVALVAPCNPRAIPPNTQIINRLILDIGVHLRLGFLTSRLILWSGGGASHS